jgi:deazaflavin-dependent oxidoreductase (nitroreductase family)
VLLPRRLARFNRVVTNRIQDTYAWLLPPWAVICHRGRRSGREYRTPVAAWKRGETVAVALLYGKDSDWVRNVLAADGGRIVRAGRTYELRSPRIVAAREASGISPPARALGRVAQHLLVAQLGEQSPGFGRGPTAG